MGTRLRCRECLIGRGATVRVRWWLGVLAADAACLCAVSGAGGAAHRRGDGAVWPHCRHPRPAGCAAGEAAALARLGARRGSEGRTGAATAFRAVTERTARARAPAVA